MRSGWQNWESATVVENCEMGTVDESQREAASKNGDGVKWLALVMAAKGEYRRPTY
jgi:hypothetical protein